MRDNQTLEQPVERRGVLQVPYFRQYPITPLRSQRPGGQAPELLFNLPVRQRVPVVPLRMARLRRHPPSVRRRHLDPRA